MSVLQGNLLKRLLHGQCHRNSSLGVCCFILGGFHSNSPFCLGEGEEVEVNVQEDFLSFDADLVAEQLTFMDAVRHRRP